MFLNRNSIQLHKLNLKYTLVCLQYHINLWVFLFGIHILILETGRINIQLIGVESAFLL